MSRLNLGGLSRRLMTHKVSTASAHFVLNAIVLFVMFISLFVRRAL